ncbi:MAG: LamG-like jellyroll fold domain-containing protein, partial [Bacteroidota bacterium]
MGGDGTGWNYFHFGPLHTNNSLSSQTWYNVIFKRNINEFSLYLNGSIADSLTINTSPINQMCELVFGNIAWSYPSEGFLGKLDDYAVWNRALSQQE